MKTGYRDEFRDAMDSLDRHLMIMNRLNLSFLSYCNIAKMGVESRGN